MSHNDRLRWDHYYTEHTGEFSIDIDPLFFPYHHLFPRTGQALELACGQGQAALWFARRGLQVEAVDVSPVAISQARHYATENNLAQQCHFSVVDLDQGLPPGKAVALIYCNRFRDSRLDQSIIERLLPGGLLAITCLSVVGGKPGPFRAQPGELPQAFQALTIIGSGEGYGRAWLLAHKP